MYDRPKLWCMLLFKLRALGAVANASQSRTAMPDIQAGHIGMRAVIGPR